MRCGGILLACIDKSYYTNSVSLYLSTVLPPCIPLTERIYKPTLPLCDLKSPITFPRRAIGIFYPLNGILCWLENPACD